MGIQALADALHNHRGLHPTARLVLIVIAEHVNSESGWAWPSVARIAALCEIDRSNVIRWLAHLEEAGHIEVRRRKGWANHYRLTSRTSATSDGECTSRTSATGLVAPAHRTRACLTDLDRVVRQCGGCD